MRIESGSWLRAAARSLIAVFVMGGLGRALYAQPVRHWAAASKVSMSITGDLRLSAGEIVFGDKSALKLSFMGAASGINNALDAAGQPVRLYRVVDPRELNLLHGNSICRATYLTTFEPAPKPGQPGDLYVAFFTGAGSPTPKDFQARMCDQPYWYVAASMQRIQAGFDCAKAAGPVETSICADADLARRDRKISQIYSALTRAQPDQAKRLLKDQRAFVAQRENCGAPERGQPSSKPALNTCVWDLTTERLDELERRAIAAGLGQKLGLKSVEPAWEAFNTSASKSHGPVCMVRSGHDGSDTLQAIRQPGNASPTKVQYEEFAYEGVGVLRKADGGGFNIDGEDFQGRVAIDSAARGKDRRFRIIAPDAHTAALLKRMETGRLLLVVRNGKVIFRVPLKGFGAAFAQAARKCDDPAQARQ